MVNDFGKAIAAFVTIPKTRQIPQSKEFDATNININIDSPPIQMGKGKPAQPVEPKC